MKRIALFIVMAGWAGSTAAQTPIAVANTPNTAGQQQVCIQHAGKLLEEIFGLLRKNYVNKDAFDLDGLSLEAKRKLESSASCEDAYDALNWCFKQMKEPHSFVMPAVKAATYNNDTSFLQFKPNLADLVGEVRVEQPDPETAYITIPPISSSDEGVATLMADSLQSIIARLDRQGVSRWMLDLRANTGGNCWPMLAGVGPLLGEGVCGYFIRNEERVPIVYKSGASWQGKNLRTAVSGKPHVLQTPVKKIMVLTGTRTCSSGEIVALAFKGLPNVELIGEATAGLTTANSTYQLSNNAMLVLSVCREADRTGRLCQGSIRPDHWVDHSEKDGFDAIKQTAYALLK